MRIATQVLALMVLFSKIIKQNNQWFMDYRNADGSIAEMCGNAILA
jgi:diaminopimelate epimerase